MARDVTFSDEVEKFEDPDAETAPEVVDDGLDDDYWAIRSLYIPKLDDNNRDTFTNESLFEVLVGFIDGVLREEKMPDFLPFYLTDLVNLFPGE